MKFETTRSLAARTLAETGETLVIVGISQSPDGAPLALVAREQPFSLEYAGELRLRIDESDEADFWRQVDKLTSDYPHVSVGEREARWLRPTIRVTPDGVPICPVPRPKPSLFPTVERPGPVTPPAV